MNQKYIADKRAASRSPEQAANGSDGIILPPRAKGENRAAYNRIINPDVMSGTERFFSVPENKEESRMYMKQYLQGFCGKNVCVSFWGSAGSKFEKCGVLTEVGGDYLSIKEHKSNRLIITNIEKIKYISVFCI